MEDLDHLQSPPPVYARPEGLGSLGDDSYFIEPYEIRSPHRVHIGDGVGIGARCSLSVGGVSEAADHEPVLRIGDRALISTDLVVQCAGGLEIGRGAGISARVFIGDSAPDYEGGGAPMDERASARVGAGALIGIGAVVFGGVAVGERAIVAAGSVVTRDVPPLSVVFGNPARVIRTWDEGSGTWRAGGR